MNNVEREMRFEIAFMTEDIKDLQKREHVEKNFVKRFFFIKEQKEEIREKVGELQRNTRVY